MDPDVSLQARRGQGGGGRLGFFISFSYIITAKEMEGGFTSAHGFRESCTSQERKLGRNSSQHGQPQSGERQLTASPQLSPPPSPSVMSRIPP